MEEEDGVPLGSWRADLSGEEGGEDEGGAPMGVGEEKWRRPLDLWREEVCNHGPCAADLKRERRGEGDGDGAGGGRRREGDTEGRGGSGLGSGFAGAAPASPSALVVTDGGCVGVAFTRIETNLNRKKGRNGVAVPLLDAAQIDA
jgi:hypothetical protein